MIESDRSSRPTPPTRDVTGAPPVTPTPTPTRTAIPTPTRTAIPTPASRRRDSARRVLWIGRGSVWLLSAVLLALLWRVGQLQHQPDERLVRQLDQHEGARSLEARRGPLLDRRGRPLAITRTAERLFVDPALIADRNTFSERVGYTLGYDPVAIELAMARRPDSRYLVIDHRLDEATAALARRLDLPGLFTETITVRDYPHGDLAGQLIGFVGRDGSGLEGLERHFDRRLSGERGRLEFLRDVRGRELWFDADGYVPPTHGGAVRLSIDVTIQAIAERELADAVQQYGARAGQLVVMHPFTGEVLAMANYPAFDPARFADTPAQVRRNRVVTDVFEPGSIFKPFVWSVATQRGLAQPQEVIDCTSDGVHVTSRGRRLRDARPHGRLTWEQVLIESSNIGMAIVAERMGEQRLHDAVRAFGFGQTTGSGLPGEVAGLITPRRKWNHYTLTSVPMGHEIGVTGLQLTRAFCVIANDGRLVTPRVRPLDADAARAAAAAPQVLPPSMAAYTRRVLRRVMTEGTGRRAPSPLYAVFGKTGTAELPDRETGTYHRDQYVASFVGGAPLDSPRLVVGCFIHRPDRSIGHYGGIVAAPAAVRVLERSLQYLGVRPDGSTAPDAPGRFVAGD